MLFRTGDIFLFLLPSLPGLHVPRDVRNGDTPLIEFIGNQALQRDYRTDRSRALRKAAALHQGRLHDSFRRHIMVRKKGSNDVSDASKLRPLKHSLGNVAPMDGGPFEASLPPLPGLEPHRFRQFPDTPLRGRVPRKFRPPELRRSGRYVHDVSAVSPLHAGQGGPDRVMVFPHTSSGRAGKTPT